MSGIKAIKKAIGDRRSRIARARESIKRLNQLDLIPKRSLIAKSKTTIKAKNLESQTNETAQIRLAQICLKTTDKKLDKRSLVNFTPQIAPYSEIIRLRPDQLEWTAKYPHGVFCFLEHKQQEYFGISFQQKWNQSRVSNYVWSVHRKFHQAEKIKPQKNYPVQTVSSSRSGKLSTPYSRHYLSWKDSPIKAVKKVENLSCIYPTQPGTFYPVAAPVQQIELFRQFLSLAEVVENLFDHEAQDQDDLECDRLRIELNLQYQKFVADYDILWNYRSYFEGVWWNDIRLSALLLHLETIDPSSRVKNKRKLIKADIFTRRQSYPGRRKFSGKFAGEDVNQRLQQAYSWCLSWYGQVDLDEIAAKTNLSVEVVEEKLRSLNLIYREVELDAIQVNRRQNLKLLFD